LFHQKIGGTAGNSRDRKFAEKLRLSQNVGGSSKLKILLFVSEKSPHYIIL
jgi:hypothetical protein